MSVYLGIDTSNYRTSAALFHADTLAWQNEGRLLDVPAGAIGLRQSEALFQHTVHLHGMLSRLPAGVGGSVRAIGVSTRPRAVEGSYMPCFLAGENVARSAAHLLDVPLSLCAHQQGHLAAAALSAGALALLHEPFLAWHLSGGTTELLLVTPGADQLPDAKQIGGTTDLAAGQLIDRAGKLLGLPFPAGAALDELALQADVMVKAFTPRVQYGMFSLSGVENKINELHMQNTPPATLARFVIETIGNAVVNATMQALKKHPLPVLCAGGVMSNTLLRAEMQKRFGALCATPQLSGDNAVGAAVLAAVSTGEA